VLTTEPEMSSEGRDEPRAQIIRAARAVVEREGVENLTLAKVAAEADLPSSVLFGQFVRKEDLLLCVAADSLAAMARAMKTHEPASEMSRPDETAQGAVILALPRQDAARESPESMVGLAKEIAIALGAAAQSEHRVAVETRPDAAALDQRLPEFERAIEAMAKRQADMELAAREAVAGMKESVGEILSKLGELVARVDQAEARQKAAASDLRTSLNDTSLRIQTVEGVARAALVKDGPGSSGVASPALHPVLEQAIVERRDLSSGEDTKPASESSFPLFAAARLSAVAAANVKSGNDKPGQAKKVESGSRYVAASLVVVSIFVAAAGVAFSQGVRDGRREALLNLAIAAPARVVSSVSPNTSLDRLTARAERGDAAAELAVAIKYLNDPRPAGDPMAAFRWMTRAAAQGNAVAQYMLGTLYQQGIGTPANAVQAMHWYEAAAAQGNRKAMHNLGVAYAEGLGGVKSPSEAVRWLSLAATLGYVDSQFDLAVLYERGEGVPQSLLDAYKWYSIAGTRGDSESKSRIDALRTQLSADDLAAAQHAADGFRPAPYNAAANLPPNI